MLERVVASHVELPDSMMTKYHIGGYAEVSITPTFIAHLPNSNLTAALLLAELYQDDGQPDKAIDLLESLGSIKADPIFALSLADLYAQLGKADDVLRVADGFTQNVDDPTCQLLMFKAGALHEKGLNDAALEVLRETLKSKKRTAEILRQCRYVRGVVYEAVGKKASARKEWEKVYAEDPNYADIASRLGQQPPNPVRPDRAV